jgi:hypothetical protein
MTNDLLARCREAARSAKACEKHAPQNVPAIKVMGCDACANAVVRAVADVLLAAQRRALEEP